VAAVRRHDGRGRWRRKELVAQALERGSEVKSEGERCGGGRGWWSPFDEDIWSLIMLSTQLSQLLMDG
jgi:hypothetical protein